MPTKKSTEVAVVDTAAYPALSGTDISTVISENLGGEQLSIGDLDSVKIPAGGGTTWEIPSLDGDRAEKELEGIIVAIQTPRVYWAQSIEEREGDDAAPPDCSSPDGSIGFGLYGPGSNANPTGECARCPMNEWGSASRAGKPSRAKACREQRRVFMLTEGALMPFVVQLPPSSIGPLRKYMYALTNASVPYFGAVTGLSLSKQTAGGVSWAVAQPRLVAKLDPEQLASARDYSEGFRALVDRAARAQMSAEGNDEFADETV